MSTKYFVGHDGQYIGAFADGAIPPQGAIEASSAPECGQSSFVDGAWVVKHEMQQKFYSEAVQIHMDAAAALHGYDSIKTAVTYADEPAVPKFQIEGLAFRAWRSLCWDYCYTQLAAVLAGHRTQPTIEQLIAELPSLDLPPPGS
jgi:hypothetical protein